MPVHGYIQVGALVGLILPTLIAVFQQVQFGDAVRASITAATCAVAAVVVAATQTDFSSHTWIVSFLTIFVTTVTSYEHFWKPLAVAPVIERATRIGKRSGPDVR